MRGYSHPVMRCTDSGPHCVDVILSAAAGKELCADIDKLPQIGVATGINLHTLRLAAASAICLTPGQTRRVVSYYDAKHKKPKINSGWISEQIRGPLYFFFFDPFSFFGGNNDKQ